MPFGAQDAGLGSLDLLVLFVFLFWQHIQEASGKKGFQLRNYLHQTGLTHSFMASASVPALKFL